MRIKIILCVNVVVLFLTTCTFMPKTNDELVEDAWNLMKKGKDKKALRYLDKAIELDATKEYVFVLRGIVNGFLKNSKAEFKDYNKAIKLNPDYAAANFNLGQWFWIEGKTDSAIVYYNKSLSNKLVKNTDMIFDETSFSFTPIKDQLTPSSSKIYHFLGLAYYDKEDYDNALIKFSYSLSNQYDIGEAQYYIGCIYIAKKKKRMACQALTIAMNEGYKDAEELLKEIDCK